MIVRAIKTTFPTLMLQYPMCNSHYQATDLIVSKTSYKPEKLETAIGPGFSGGPVLDSRGEIVGINVAANAYNAQKVGRIHTVGLMCSTLAMNILHSYTVTYSPYIGNPTIALFLMGCSRIGLKLPPNYIVSIVNAVNITSILLSLYNSRSPAHGTAVSIKITTTDVTRWMSSCLQLSN